MASLSPPFTVTDLRPGAGADRPGTASGGALEATPDETRHIGLPNSMMTQAGCTHPSP